MADNGERKRPRGVAEEDASVYGTPAEVPRAKQTVAARLPADPLTQELTSILAPQVQRTKELFASCHDPVPTPDAALATMKRRVKARAMYAMEEAEGEDPRPLDGREAVAAPAGSGLKLLKGPSGGGGALTIPKPTGEGNLVLTGDKEKAAKAKKEQLKDSKRDLQVLPVSGSQLKKMHERLTPKARWHAPWKLHKVIAGHLGWVRTIAVDWSNEWFVSSGADRSIKIWDLASGTLKLTLTGHISAIRGACISRSSPYLFTCSEDGSVKCWDLEQNKAVRNYHGHLNGVYCCALHPTLDILASGGRDGSVRVWDVRSRAEVHTLTGHKGTVSSLVMQATDPQIISGSQDTMIRMWDIVAGKTQTTLTHHKKTVRALALHPKEYTFVSGSPDSIRKWRLPGGEFIDKFKGQECIVNAVALNDDGVLASGGDNGSLYFWDWKSCTNFQRMQTIPQSGSLASEAGIYCATFDHSGSRLLTGEADKTIKIWREVPDATPETHPTPT